MDLELVARSKFTKAKADIERTRRTAPKEGRKEIAARRSTANFWMQITVVSKGALRMKTQGGSSMQIESCYGRLLRLRPNLRHLNMTREPTPFSRRGKCEFSARRRGEMDAKKKALKSRTSVIFFSAAYLELSLLFAEQFAKVNVV